MSNQPEVNIGMVGHVDHGKTTLTESLSGKWTDTHSEEIKRGITIRLGYADVNIRKCQKCEPPGNYSTELKCPTCGEKTELSRIISLVDAPGHESLMATMLAGATIIDGALLLIAANEHCPQPQTQEHLMALQIIGIKKVVVVQNKIDLVSKEVALQNYELIKNFLKGTPFEDAPIIPISAQRKVNIDALLFAIEEAIPTPKRDAKKEPVMLVARSFDINRPGIDPLTITGGVLGGTLKEGTLKVGDEIEIRPGLKQEKGGKTTWIPISSSISDLKTAGESVDEIGPGGSVGVQTLLDPSIVKSDSLVGAIAGHKGSLPPVWYEFELRTHLLERVVGLRDELVVEPLKIGEYLMLNVNSAATVGTIAKLGKDSIKVILKIPVCATKGSRVTISRRIGARWRLIGYGTIES
ncbi:MAG: translation initiation factor IF-2 subunit gamma [Nanoarchaeota archaeon]|mgnify:CR=1 FL=1